jgi:A/G-specific adenine glycosylase
MGLTNEEAAMAQIRVNTHSGKCFSSALLEWNAAENERQMPWKGEKDPYKIWISEIILQQTRVEQGLKYYENFISEFPDLKSLAEAPDEKIFKRWEGLGYYSRCRNLIHSARHIHNELGSNFPSNYEDILQLKGVGNYTAAAIASFAYNLPHAVLDGNVFRVLSRIFGIEIAVDSTRGKKVFANLAQFLLPKQKAGEYNQALMDFGATICKPSPDCHKCFFTHSCTAFLTNTQELLPVKEKKISIKERWFFYFMIVAKGQVAVRQRTGRDIWQGLHEFLLIEKPVATKKEIIFKELGLQTGLTNFKITGTVNSDQKLTHQLIHFSVCSIEIDQVKPLDGFTWIPFPNLHEYAFPKTLQQFIIRANDPDQLAGRKFDYLI